MKKLITLSLTIIFFLSCKEKVPQSVKKNSADSVIKISNFYYDFDAHFPDSTKAIIVCNTNLKEYAVMVDTLYYGYTGDYLAIFIYTWSKQYKGVTLVKNGHEQIFASYKEALKIKNQIDNYESKKRYDDSIANLKHHYQICKPTIK